MQFLLDSTKLKAKMANVSAFPSTCEILSKKNGGKSGRFIHCFLTASNFPKIKIDKCRKLHPFLCNNFLKNNFKYPSQKK